jgi:heme oxygenase (biliverdin-IX-beta and delta-forming)
MDGGMNQTAELDFSLSRRLKIETAAAHEALDSRIMAGDPFASRARYGRFIAVQHQFHRDIHAVYRDPRIAAILPDLMERSRLEDLEADLRDLGQPDGATDGHGPGDDLGERLGWLYVAEGSNLGAAFLIKAAAKLDLDEHFGARHLAGHPEGRGLHWKRFQQALDTADLGEAVQDRAVAGAVAAFKRVKALADAAFAD